MDGEICIANIGPRQRARRTRIGVVLFLVGLGLLGALIGFDAPRVARLACALPFSIGATSLIQAREHT